MFCVLSVLSEIILFVCLRSISKVQWVSYEFVIINRTDPQNAEETNWNGEESRHWFSIAKNWQMERNKLHGKD